MENGGFSELPVGSFQRQCFQNLSELSKIMRVRLLSDSPPFLLLFPQSNRTSIRSQTPLDQPTSSTPINPSWTPTLVPSCNKLLLLSRRFLKKQLRCLEVNSQSTVSNTFQESLTSLTSLGLREENHLGDSTTLLSILILSLRLEDDLFRMNQCISYSI